MCETPCMGQAFGQKQLGQLIHHDPAYEHTITHSCTCCPDIDLYKALSDTTHVLINSDCLYFGYFTFAMYETFDLNQ